jgi:hypothetical protein
VAYKKIINLIDLSNVVISLGTQLPDFLDFYNSAKLNGITPFNMRLSLNLAMNIESLNQASINMHTQLHAVTNTLGQERANLKEIQRQIAGLVEYRQRTKNEIKLLNRVIKNSNEYRIFEKLIRDSVNSLTSENYFLLEVAIIAIMTMIQKDPTTIPLLQFPFPDKLDMDVHTTFNQLILYNLIQKAAVFMPKVLDELMKLIGTRVLRNPQDLDAYLHFQSGLSSQCYGEASPQIQSESELNAKSRQPSEIPESIVRDDIFRDKFELENNGIISASDRDQILDDDFFFYCLLSC